MKVKAAEYTTSYGKKCSGCFSYFSAYCLLAGADYEGNLPNMLATIKCLLPVRYSLIVVTKNRSLFFG